MNMVYIFVTLLKNVITNHLVIDLFYKKITPNVSVYFHGNIAIRDDGTIDTTKW
jgi:proteasome assembly chaperone (PAC2) family protein